VGAWAGWCFRAGFADENWVFGGGGGLR